MTREWRAAPRGLRTCILWSDWLSRDQALDPYLVWADLSDALGFARPEQPDAGTADDWPFLVEFAQASFPAPDPSGTLECPGSAAACQVPWILGCIRVSSAYFANVEKTPDHPTGWVVDGSFVTARIAPSMLRTVLACSDVKAIQLGLPRIPGVSTDPVSVSPLPVADQRVRVVVGVVDDGCAFANAAFSDPAGGTRVRYLWDQDPRRVPDATGANGTPVWWTRLPDFGYGAELTPLALRNATLLARARNDEALAYEVTRFGHWRLDADTHAASPISLDGFRLPAQGQLLGSHGTAVTDLAAGYPPPQRAQRAALPHPTPLSLRVHDDSERALLARHVRRLQEGRVEPGDADLLAIDTGEQFDIVFVQLPSRAVADTSGGSLGVHVLDAICYIQRRTVQLPYIGSGNDDSNTAANYTLNRLILNISYGALAGGHDGTSLAERAIRERSLSMRCWTNTVIAAGNADRAGTHVEFDLGGVNCDVTLSWSVGPDNPLESYLELWLPDRDTQDGKTFERLSRHLFVGVTTPAGENLAAVTMGQAQVLQDTHVDGACPAAAHAAVVFSRRVVQSERGTMVLVAVGRTRSDAQSRLPSLHGEWQVRLGFSNDADSAAPPLRVHAWSERNDLLFEPRRAQQATVSLDPPAADPSEFEPAALRFRAQGRRVAAWTLTPPGFRRRMTLSSLASLTPARVTSMPTSGQCFVVGSYRVHDGEMALGSAGGPSRLFSDEDYWAALSAWPGRPDGTSRLAPDLDAPSDLSAASPGLRVAGHLGETSYRISGTSAAAACATRALAQWQLALEAERRYSVDFAGMADKVKSLLFAQTPFTSDSPESRATLRPVTDDLFRKGRARVR